MLLTRQKDGTGVQEAPRADLNGNSLGTDQAATRAPVR